MASKQTLTIELVRAKLINAKREKEASVTYVGHGQEYPTLFHEWKGQEIMAQQLLDILEK